MSNKIRTKKRRLEHWQIIAILLAVYDMIVVAGSYFLALYIRFDGKWQAIPDYYWERYSKFIPFYCVICVVVFYIFQLYKTLWRFASLNELLRMVYATCVTVVIHIVGMQLFLGRMPISYYIIGGLLQFGFTLIIRFMYRFVLIQRQRINNNNKGNVSNVMIIGGGEAGQQIIRDIKNQSNTYEVKCVIDDNPNKWNRLILGVPIVGGRDEILYSVEKYKIDKIFIAIPSAARQDVADIINICKETACEIKNLPGITQLASGDVDVSLMKNIDVEDLLGREPVKVNLDEIASYITGKVVLVTGGGGSIGSELCRQIVKHQASKLVVFDIYENNAYEIQQELKRNYPDFDLEVIIGSVRDTRRVNNVFETYKPDIVFHAAAHKHVPLMEDSPCETIKNNVLGTYKTAYAAMVYQTKKFVLISTDKAVNPTNIMGASKRLCEMVIQTFDWAKKNNKESMLPVINAHGGSEEKFTGKCVTEFVAVRFGNVLGSNGSVIPLFKKQIENGGPVTVTHPDIIRYFMTIPEAVSLVLQAGSYGEGGEIFVLDMGEPVKIDTLARNLIKLSGYRPDVDIKIEYTGLRPGEKLYEEKLMAEEGLKKTENKLIHIGMPIAFDHELFITQLVDLTEAAYSNSPNIKEEVRKIVTTYNPD